MRFLYFQTFTICFSRAFNALSQFVTLNMQELSCSWIHVTFLVNSSFCLFTICNFSLFTVSKNFQSFPSLFFVTSESSRRRTSTTFSLILKSNFTRNSKNTSDRNEVMNENERLREERKIRSFGKLSMCWFIRSTRWCTGTPGVFVRKFMKT